MQNNADSPGTTRTVVQPPVERPDGAGAVPPGWYTDSRDDWYEWWWDGESWVPAWRVKPREIVLRGRRWATWLIAWSTLIVIGGFTATVDGVAWGVGAVVRGVLAVTGGVWWWLVAHRAVQPPPAFVITPG